jgi:hypothetical protein
MTPTAIECAGCGWRLPDGDPIVLRCPAAVADDDIDHVVTRVLEPSRLSFPQGTEPEPFVRYRTLFHGYHAGREIGLSDADLVALVERLDGAVAEVDGRGFRETQFARSTELSDRLGFSAARWGLGEGRDRTSLARTARHLIGTLIGLEVADIVRAAVAGPDADAGSAPAAPVPLAVSVVRQRRPGRSGHRPSRTAPPRRLHPGARRPRRRRAPSRPRGTDRGLRSRARSPATPPTSGSSRPSRRARSRTPARGTSTGSRSRAARRSGGRSSRR